MAWSTVGMDTGRPLRRISAVLQVAVVFLLLCVREGDCLKCHCSDCPTSPESGHVWPSCYVEGSGTACYIKTVSSPAGPLVRRGCVSGEDMDAACGLEDTLCCHSDRCNGRVGRLAEEGKSHLRKLLQSDITSESMPGMSDDDKIAAIITSSVCVVLVTAIVALVITFAICCLYFYRGNHRAHAHSDVEAGHVMIGNCCSAIIPQGETISSLLTASHSPTNSAPSPSLSLLVQRSIVKNVAMVKVLESGRFCDVSVGRWRNDQVLVKSYSTRHERMWFSETQLHQIPHMHHPHLLTFIAADYHHTHTQLRHCLVTEYHQRGSLTEYLHDICLDMGAMVVLAQSAASGLAHLHLEVKGLSLEKPSIVHRNVSSGSFYVKNDGTCCLGDLSLAVKDDAHFLEEVKGKPLGHTPYLSPEVLESYVSQESLSCAVWKKADVYALGLVMWQIARRCLIQGNIESAELPFAAMLTSDQPSLEEMRQIVCAKNLRPTLAEHWNQDETMQSCVQVLTECWQQDPNLRPSAMSVKNSLDKLLPSLKLSSNYNKSIKS